MRSSGVRHSFGQNRLQPNADRPCSTNPVITFWNPPDANHTLVEEAPHSSRHERSYGRRQMGLLRSPGIRVLSIWSSLKLFRLSTQ